MFFTKFTRGAIAALVSSTDEARRLRHDYIGTEHIFLGLLSGDCESARVLNTHGLTIEQARVDVPAALFRKPTQKEQGWLALVFGASQETPFTADSKRILDLAWKQAQSAGLNKIGDSHILIALMDSHGPAKDILEQHKLDLKKIKQELLVIHLDDERH